MMIPILRDPAESAESSGKIEKAGILAQKFGHGHLARCVNRVAGKPAQAAEPHSPRGYPLHEDSALVFILGHTTPNVGMPVVIWSYFTNIFSISKAPRDRFDSIASAGKLFLGYLPKYFLAFHTGSSPHLTMEYDKSSSDPARQFCSLVRESTQSHFRRWRVQISETPPCEIHAIRLTH